MVKFRGINHLAMATGDMDTTIRATEVSCSREGNSISPGYD